MEKKEGSWLENLIGWIVVIAIIIFISGGCDDNSDAGNVENSIPKEPMNSIESTYVPSSYEVSILVDYEKAFATSNTPMNVVVDGEKINLQEAGTTEVYTLFLEEGEHTICLKNNGFYSTSKINFIVSENNVVFEFGARTRLTFGVEFWEKDYSADIEDENQKNFIVASTQFYNLYLDYFGENYSIDNEPFENGRYKNEEKYKELALILDDMCRYYEVIEKKDDRYEVLRALDYSMYDYIYNVAQMIIFIDGKRYDEEKFYLEYSDYIVC